MKIIKNHLINTSLLLAFLSASGFAAPTKEIPGDLQKQIIQEMPEADTNKDGTIDDREFRGVRNKIPKPLRNAVQNAQAGLNVPDPLSTLSQAEQDARMAWFREVKFGMFIHWGVYAEFAGYYKGEEGWKYSEHIMSRMKIPVEEYKAVAATFNPVDFDAEEWVLLAKEAGMKYITITAKHHDGFSMYPSEYTDYDIMDHTRFGRDPFQELADACKKYGLRFCIYYSHMDWYYTHGKADYSEFRINQVSELIEKYDPGVLWFDDFGHNGDMELLNTLRTNYPNVLLPDRVTQRHAGHGDFRTPEQTIPRGAQDVDWESCITLNDSWGYHKGDNNWKSTEDLVHKLIDIASKGGNFLLNVGPGGKGVIPPESVERLQEVGKWMQVNGEAIYGTTIADVESTDSVKYTTKDGKLYAFILQWPDNGVQEVKVGSDMVKQAHMLGDGRNLNFKQSADGIVVNLRDSAPKPLPTVLVLER